jgi:hypothetical protein
MIYFHINSLFGVYFYIFFILIFINLNSNQLIFAEPIKLNWVDFIDIRKNAFSMHD